MKNINDLEVPEWRPTKGSHISQPGRHFRVAALLSARREWQSSEGNKRAIREDSWGIGVLVHMCYPSPLRSHLMLTGAILKLIYSVVSRPETLCQCQKSNLKFPFYLGREGEAQVKTAPRSDILYWVR